jgi:hypothetical protein
MWDNDICLCGNAAECPNKDTCRRARKHGPGVYTISYFYKEGEKCEYYLKRKEVDKNAKSKN